MFDLDRRHRRRRRRRHRRRRRRRCCRRCCRQRRHCRHCLFKRIDIIFSLSEDVTFCACPRGLSKMVP